MAVPDSAIVTRLRAAGCVFAEDEARLLMSAAGTPAELDAAAVRCAGQNLPGGRVYQGDLYAPLPAGLRGRIAILAANVPYVPSEEIGFLPPEARAHEHRAALDGGADGLDVLRRVAT